MDSRRSKKKNSQPDKPSKSNQPPKKQNLLDQLMQVDKVLIENSSAADAKRQEIFDLLTSDDKKSKVGAVELHCTELKNFQTKCGELNENFTVTANVFAGQLKAEEGNTSKKMKAKKKACGLCGETKKLTKSECCNQWICDDADQYVMFSYAKNSCYRNHHRFTLCNHHFTEGHSGKWQNCTECKKNFKDRTEMYVWYATNNYNYEKLDIPKIKIKCQNCTFESYEVEDFAGSLSEGKETKWYCKNEECLKNSPLCM